MTIKENFKILSAIGQVTSHKWRMIMEIVDSINNNKKTTVIKAEWAALYKQENPEYGPPDLSDRNTWSTFDDTCIDLRFVVEEKKLKCYALIYDGTPFAGERSDLKFLAEIQLQNNFINKIDGLIQVEFRWFLERKHEKYLELKKRKWMSDMKNEILK